MRRFASNLLAFLACLVAIAVIAIAPWPAWIVLLALFLAWMAWTRAGRQARSVTAIGLGTLPDRYGASAVIVVGIGGVVAVLVALLAMAEGYRQTLSGTGRADTAIVLRGGSAAEPNSVLGRDEVVAIGDAPGVARDAAGKPLASGEVVVAANLPLRGGRGADDVASVPLRGVGEQGWAIRPGVHITSGRAFQPGMRELVVGRGALRQFAGLEPGSSVRLGAQDWRVVGVFESHDALESEVWGDATDVAEAYRRGASVSSVTVRLASPAALAGFKAALESDPRLKVEVQSTADYFARQSEGITKVIRVVGLVVGSIMAIGALFGALNTMFAAVAARAREIATLRAIGFRGGSVVVAVMVETLLLALAGGVLGGLLARLVFNGYTASSIGGGIGLLTFEFKVTPALLGTGIAWALAIGFAGGIYPALRAARQPVNTALRDA